MKMTVIFFLHLFRRNLFNIGRDQESSSMKTYVINIPNVGPYVVMVRPTEEELGNDGDGDTVDSRPVFPGTESEDNGARRMDKEEEDLSIERQKEQEQGDVHRTQRRVNFIPYHNVNFFKSI